MSPQRPPCPRGKCDHVEATNPSAPIATIFGALAVSHLLNASPMRVCRRCLIAEIIVYTPRGPRPASLIRPHLN